MSVGRRNSLVSLDNGRHLVIVVVVDHPDAERQPYLLGLKVPADLFGFATSDLPASPRARQLPERPLRLSSSFSAEPALPRRAYLKVEYFNFTTGGRFDHAFLRCSDQLKSPFRSKN